VLLPRLAADAASTARALPTRFETDIAVAGDLAAMGDSHNPDYPYFAGFRRQVMAQYGVSRVEDLPVNFKGLLGIEGERMTSALFDRYAEASFDRQHSQSRWMDAFGLFSPVLALRRLSMTVAGTDLDSYRRFLVQGERYRYTLIQSLNRLQAEQIGYADDRNPNRQARINREHWHDQPDFVFEPRSRGQTVRSAAPAAAVLMGWILAVAALLRAAGRRLGRVAR